MLSSSAERDRVLEQTPPPGTMQSQADPVLLRAGSGPNRIVPDVVGLCREQAEALVKAAGFVCRVEYTEGYAHFGFVTEQTPAGGSSAQGEVTISVGGRREIVTVPDVVGLSLGEARQRPNSVGLGVAVEGIESDDATVTSSAPGGDEKLLVGSLVTLTTK